VSFEYSAPSEHFESLENDEWPASCLVSCQGTGMSCWYGLMSNLRTDLNAVAIEIKDNDVGRESLVLFR
jgi:hypothetical protein